MFASIAQSKKERVADCNRGVVHRCCGYVCERRVPYGGQGKNLGRGEWQSGKRRPARVGTLVEQRVLSG
jgi:hypothetical protein